MKFGIAFELLLHQHFVSTILDVEYLPSQADVIYTLGIQDEQRQKEWLVYPQYVLFESIEGSIQQGISFLLQKVERRFQTTTKLVQKWSTFCKSQDPTIIYIIGKLCSPHELQNELSLQQQRYALFQYHLKNKLELPTPPNVSQSHLFFVANTCSPKNKAHIFTSCTFMEHTCHIIMWKEWWVFNLHPVLRTNLSFAILNLKYTRNCSSECFIVRRSAGSFLECMYDEEIMILFCGHKPRSSVSPNALVFVVMVRHSHKFYRSLELQFSVISSGLIIAYYQPDLAFYEKHSGTLGLKWLLFRLYGVSVSYFLVQTKKHLKLNLHRDWSESDIVWIFDGPGTLCPLLNYSSVALSSFQALISILTKDMTQYMNDREIQFFSSHHVDKSILLLKGESQIINSSHKSFRICRQQGVTHCVISIAAPSKLPSCTLQFPYVSCPKCCNLQKSEWFVNITVQSINMQGYKTDHCLYSGLSVHQSAPRKPFLDSCRMKFQKNKLVQTILQQHKTVCKLKGDSFEPFNYKNDFLICNSTTSSESNIVNPMFMVSNLDSVSVSFYSFFDNVKQFELVLLVKPTQCKGVFVTMDDAVHMKYHKVRSPFSQDLPDFFRIGHHQMAVWQYIWNMTLIGTSAATHFKITFSLDRRNNTSTKSECSSTLLKGTCNTVCQTHFHYLGHVQESCMAAWVTSLNLPCQQMKRARSWREAYFHKWKSLTRRTEVSHATTRQKSTCWIVAQNRKPAPP